MARNKMDNNSIKAGDLVILDPHYLPGDRSGDLCHGTVAIVTDVIMHAYVVMFNNRTYDIRRNAVKHVNVINFENNMKVGDIVKTRNVNKFDPSKGSEAGVIIVVDMNRHPGKWILVSFESGTRWFWPSELELSLKE